jgi:hypothetical protein
MEIGTRIQSINIKLLGHQPQYTHTHTRIFAQINKNKIANTYAHTLMSVRSSERTNGLTRTYL